MVCNCVPNFVSLAMSNIVIVLSDWQLSCLGSNGRQKGLSDGSRHILLLSFLVKCSDARRGPTLHAVCLGCGKKSGVAGSERHCGDRLGQRAVRVTGQCVMG